MGDQEEEIIDLHSMKVVELKAELKQRKLPVSGTKAELIDRLEKYMTEHEGVEAVDEDELDKPVGKVEKPKEVVAEKKADSPKAPAGLSLAEEDEEPAKPEKTKSDEDKKQSRSARFGSIDASSDLALQKRAERFGTGNTNDNKKIQNNISADTDTLKKRADRFGIATDQATKSITKSEVDDKKKSRAERFGLTAQLTSTRNANDDGLAAKRAKKFGTAGPTSTDDSKKADRAKRFAN